MEVVDGTPKYTPEEVDIISSMPDDVINNILERLPIHEAVRTGILSREWRYKWTKLTQLVFDFPFRHYLLRGSYRDCAKIIISRLLLHLRGSITRFDLFIWKGHYLQVDEEDINNWIFFLSRKGLKVLTLVKYAGYPFRLSRHIFSCVELSHLELYNFELGPVPDHFRGFPNLSSSNFQQGQLHQTYSFGKFLTQYCPNLESLMFSSDIYHIYETDIAKLVNLKKLYWEVGSRHKKTFTSSQIFRAIGSLTKLSDLCINFRNCLQVLEDVRSAPTANLASLKKLDLRYLNISSKTIVSFIFELICASPNLHSLEIKTAYVWEYGTPEIDKIYSRIKQLQQLQEVKIY